MKGMKFHLIQHKKRTIIISNLSALQIEINHFLAGNIAADTAQPVLNTAMQYSLLAGGKRLRPALTLATYQSLGQTLDSDVLKASCAVELLHTYSLIHDDLPAMDNDDLRRGKPTNHKKFGAGIATLAGDGLLTLAFQWLVDNQLPATTTNQLVAKLAIAAGPAGMVAGQTSDIEGEHQHLTLSQLQLLHSQKTGALIEYAISAGGILAHAQPEVMSLLSSFGKSFGLAFQIYDDLMDVVGSVEQMGKQVHKDHDEHKNTYPELIGIDETKAVLLDTVVQLKAIKAQLEQSTHQSFQVYDEFIAYFDL